jgi:hypothetical protein
MTDQSEGTNSNPWRDFIRRRWPWIVLGILLLLVVVVRFRLRSMALERDEGEYAYAGQLMLHGIPPYKEAYNMKLPGTYAAYALIMAIFGQTPSGIHFGLLLVNIASILLLYFLARKLMDETGAVTTAVVFGLLSLSPTLLGLAAHATHFVVLPALGGMLLLLPSGKAPTSPPAEERVKERRPSGSQSLTPQPTNPFASGLLFGLAFLMKQHGIFFGIFGGLYLLWITFGPKPAKGRTQLKPWFSAPLRPLGMFALGCLLPYMFMCLILWRAGVFHQFVFWTISYASKYASAVPLVVGPDMLKAALHVAVGPNFLLWLLPWAGALLLWWDEHLSVAQRFFLAALLLCSIASVSVSLFFREHYFILLLPALALLSGVAVSHCRHLLRYDRTIALFYAAPVVGLFIIAALASLIGNGAIWFATTPAEAVRVIYGSTLFPEAASIGEYLKSHTAKDSRIAVLGSEPEIYFYADRRSATGYIYTYPLMDVRSFAVKMQTEMIGEIEHANPEYFVYVGDRFSWLPQPGSNTQLNDWWQLYWPGNLEMVMQIEIREVIAASESANQVNESQTARENSYIQVLKRGNRGSATKKPE